MGLVVDSSVFIAAERGRFDWVGFHAEIGAEPLYLTVITLAELLHGAKRADTEGRRATRRKLIADVEERYPLLPFERPAHSPASQNRADWIRTSDLLNPIQAHYQAVLRPEIFEEPERNGLRKKGKRIF
jgi:predicted nucleic acid-binding protein